MSAEEPIAPPPGEVQIEGLNEEPIKEPVILSGPADETALLLSASSGLSYYQSRRFCGKFFVEHEAEFGYLGDTPLHDDEVLAKFIISMYGEQKVPAFKNAAEAIIAFNSAYMQVMKASGNITGTDAMVGYYFGGPLDQLLRAVRQAVAITEDTKDSAQELTNKLTGTAKQLMGALIIETEEEQSRLVREMEKVLEIPHESLDQVAASISVASKRRDKRAVAFVLLAMAGWEPDLDGWEKHVASLIRGNTPFKGEYRLPMTLEIAVRRDILIGISLERRDTYVTLNGTKLLRTDTLHVGQDKECRYVRTSKKKDEYFVGLMWPRLERTSEMDWETVIEFVLQTGDVTEEWTEAFERLMEIAKMCVSKDGPETGRVFIQLTNSLKETSPNLHKIWEKALSQISFTGLTASTKTAEEARTALLERMVLSIITDSSCYHIGSRPIHLRVEGGTASLFDSDGNKVFVDGYVEGLEDKEEKDIGTKFFALVARALADGPIKPVFYQDASKESAALIGKGIREGFDRHGNTEDRVTRTWEQMCRSPFGKDRKKA